MSVALLRVVSLISTASLPVFLFVGADLRVVCPSDSSFYAYDSIASMNADILQQVDAINSSPLVNAQPNYTYNFCPNTTFDGNDRLTPLLNNSFFVCGRNGQASDNCIIAGGQVQIYLTDEATTAINASNVSSIVHDYRYSFSGLTLDSSTNFGVAAFGSNASTAEFFDCHWKNNSGVDSNTGGGSSIHIVYEPFVPATTLTREESYYYSTGDVSMTNIFEQSHAMQNTPIGTNRRRRRLLQNQQIGMNIHLYNSSITNGFQTNALTYRAIFSEGFILLHNVTIAYNNGGLLTNIVGGRAVIENSLFAENVMSAVIRVTEGGSLLLRNTKFVQNQGTANVVIIDSDAKIESCGYLDNKLVTAEIFSAANFLTNSTNGSMVELSDSCFVGSTVSTPVFVDEFSNTTGWSNFGSNLIVSGFCVNSPWGIFRETPGFSCFQGASGIENCKGVCEPFDSGTCILADLTRIPTNTPSQPPTMDQMYAPVLTPSFEPTRTPSMLVSANNPSNPPIISKLPTEPLPSSSSALTVVSNAIRFLINSLVLLAVLF